MKKIFTLALLTLFVSISAMADTVLGDPTFSIKDGGSINPTKLIDGEGIILSFPNATELDAFTVSGKLESEGAEAIEFDGLEGTFTAGCVITGLDGVAEKTAYTLSITSVKVNNVEMLTDTTYVLHFTTRSTERKLSWDLAQTVTADEEAKLNELINAGDTRWAVAGSGTKARFQYKQDMNAEILTIDGTTPISMTDGLYITTKASQLLVAQSAGTSVKRLHLAQPGNIVMIPDCQEGDKIAIKHGYVDTKKTYSIQIKNAVCEDATNEAKDSVQSPKSATLHVFTVTKSGDLEIIVNNSIITSIDITPKSDDVYKYTVVAKDQDGNVLKTLVEEKEGNAGDIITVPYSYWLKSADDKLLTCGTKGSEFTQKFTLKSDTTFVLTYKTTGIENVVYLSEGEDIEESVLCTHANSAIRSSNQKAAYVDKDTKLVTLQPGSYKVSAVLFDSNKSASYIATLQYGEEIVYLSATATNFDEEISRMIEIKEPTDLILKAGGNENQGIDAIAVYNSSDAPDPEIYFEKKTIEINGDSVANVLSVEGGWEDGSISYKSADTTIATVNAEGKVAGIAVGTTTITATYTYNGGKSKLTATYDVTVNTATIDAGINNLTTATTKKSVSKSVKNGKLYIETKNGTYNAVGALIK